MSVVDHHWLLDMSVEELDASLSGQQDGGGPSADGQSDAAGPASPLSVPARNGLAGVSRYSLPVAVGDAPTGPAADRPGSAPIFRPPRPLAYAGPASEEGLGRAGPPPVTRLPVNSGPAMPVHATTAPSVPDVDGSAAVSRQSEPRPTRPSAYDEPGSAAYETRPVLRSATSGPVITDRSYQSLRRPWRVRERRFYTNTRTIGRRRPKRSGRTNM